MKILKKVNIKKAITILNKHGSKTILVVDKNNKLLGTLSDGDIRKSIIKGFNLKDSIEKIYNDKPFFLYKEDRPHNIKKIFLKKKIDLIPIVNKQLKVLEIILFKNIFDKQEKEKKVDEEYKNYGVVIMAGGKGIRMQPYTKVFPKPLLPVGNETVIDIIISKFLNFKINNFYITTNYKHNIIKDHFKKYSNSINFKLIKEKKKLGTAGSLAYLKNASEDVFFISNCDVVINEDYKKIINFHHKNKNDLTIIASKKSLKIPYGVCLIDEKKKFIGFREKPKYDFLFNTGLYLVNKNILKDLIGINKLDMDNFILKLKYKKKKIGIFSINFESWQDFGDWDNYNSQIKE